MHVAECDEVATLIQPHVVRLRPSGACGARLHSFRMVRPPLSGTQEQALSWLAEAHLRAEETQRLNKGLSPIDPTFARHNAQADAPLWLFT